MMKNVPILALTLAVAVGSFAAVGCSGNTADSQQPQTSASALTKAPVGANTHGVVKIVGEALGEVPLRPDQRVELEKLAVAAEARHAAMVDGRKELGLALADQVEAGSIDRAALQPKIDKVAADLEKSRPDDRAALVRVHALLDPDQRNAFVDALETHMKGKHGGPQQGFGHMKQLADDLKLSDEQRSQIKDAMKGSHAGHSFRDMGAQMHAGKQALETFRTEKFEPPAKPVDVHQKAEEGTTRMVAAAEKILPLLTPEQRKIAADKIRTFAATGAPGPFVH